MPSPESQYPLMLEQFFLQNQEIVALEYAGGGNAGYVFKFKFDNPQLNPFKLQGIQRKLVYDNFFIECRINGSLIVQKLNGKLTPFCYGWILVPTEVEIYVAKKFNVQSFLWDRPPDATNERVRAILFEWVDGKMLSQVHLTSHIANQTRNTLKELHQASIAHSDIRAANILANKEDRVYLIDLNSSLILSPENSSPKQKISQERKLKEAQENDLRDLEIGFALLSQLPINKNVSVADLSLLGGTSLEDILIEYASMEHHWRPPAPSFWHKAL
ncbi:hypothetical protein B7463_g6065, partial [Scytalidium lignicola]